MYKFTIFTVLSVFFLSPVAPSPLVDKSLHKRDYTGQGTYYNTGGYGACGWMNTDAQPNVALSVAMYGSGSRCGQWVTIKNKANGQTASGEVVDKCEGCNTDDLDMSPSLFEQLGTLATGRLDIEWNFGSTA